MSEYWKSTPKYWCKHCSTFVKDTPFEKKQHEETGRHQGQLKRFLRGIQNDHEKEAREKQKAKAEVERLNKAVGGTSSTTSAPVSSFKKTCAASKTPATAADRKKQIQQLVDMGVAVPDEYRADMALAGDWKTVSQRKVVEPVIDESLNKGVRKRRFDGQEEEEEAGETVIRRGWGSTTKRYPDENADDLDALFSMNSLKKEENQTVKKESEPSLEIDNVTNILPRIAKPDPDLGDEKPSLGDIPSEPPAPLFKKRKQKAFAG